MGSLRRKTATRPVPDGAEIITKGAGQKAETLARWVDSKGRIRTAKLTTGNDGQLRIVAQCGTWLMKFRDGAGIVREQSTGCRDKDAARAVLNDAERRSELVRAGVLTAEQNAIADYATLPLSTHVEAYVVNMRSRGLTESHIAVTIRYVDRLADACRFNRLSDIDRSRFDRWLADQRQSGTGARTLNGFRTAWIAFLNWCVAGSRLSVNPLAGIPKANEKVDRRRQRRAMTEAELRRLLHVARWRPLAEAGRESEAVEPEEGARPKRSNWRARPLTFDIIDAAVERARLCLNGKPETVATLERTGRERQLIYKMLVTTGLRKKELASIRLRNLDLDSDPAFLTLDAADEKNREGNTIPLRQDLANDLRQWIADRAAVALDAVRREPTVAFKARLLPSGNYGESESLPADAPLFDVPAGLLRIMNRDLEVAGISKRDDRGRTLDVHSLRTTFGTHLSRAGVPLRTAQAAMRHSSPTLTANIYTDPRLLDVHGAVESLPTLELNDPRRDDREALRATGTAGERGQKVPPAFPPTSGNWGNSESLSVLSATPTDADDGNPDRAESPRNQRKKADFPANEETGLESGRLPLV